MKNKKQYSIFISAARFQPYSSNVDIFVRGYRSEYQIQNDICFECGWRCRGAWVVCFVII